MSDLHWGRSNNYRRYETKKIASDHKSYAAEGNSDGQTDQVMEPPYRGPTDTWS